jgi:DNA-binding NarL/FixJ family response regulator
MTGVRMVIVDDDPTMRAILRSLVEAFGADVLAEAGDGLSAIEQAELHHPQLILLDVSMPVMGGFAAARYLRAHEPDLHIVLISQYTQKVYAEEALQLGVRGYIYKAAAATELVPALCAVMNGGTYVSPNIRGLDGTRPS